MSLRLYLHTRNERAETTTLLDSGATENFIHLDYARKKRLTVKQLVTPRKIVNVDGTPNAKGEIRYYVDLDMSHGAAKVRLRFFLTDIGDRDIILGYPWFAWVPLERLHRPHARHGPGVVGGHSVAWGRSELCLRPEFGG